MTTFSYLDFAPPAALRVRGTVLIVPGRGETVDSYRRFGARIAADSYFVRLVEALADGEPLEEQLSRQATALADAVADLGEEPVRPLVIVGSDVAAAGLLALVARGDPDASWWPDAVVLAAIPGYGEHAVGGDWESELEVRTHCPVQRGVLSGDAELSRGSLSEAVGDALLDAAYASTASVPQLLLVGDSDPIADREALALLAQTLPNARLSIVRGGHHDILNDLQHRSVAAEVVSFLEALRDGTPPRPLITVASSAW